MVKPVGNKLTDLEDARFILYEQFKIEELCSSERFEDHSRETFEMIVDTAEKLALNYFAPCNAEGDREGCSWSGGKVKAPGSFHSPYKKFCEGDWISAPESYEVGGQNIPLTLYYVCKEMFFAANHSLSGYLGLTHSAAKVLESFGTEEQKRRYMTPLYSGRYAGSMALTEPQAGSDVGAIKLKAVKNEDGTYNLTGGKIFITGGEHNLAENIIHIVLARIEGDPEGAKGLSCFVVPGIRLNEDGLAMDDNDISCISIEHKMGMKGSATCVLNYGENGRCVGELLGPERKGIVVMFHMMNEQRILVGLQGLALGSAAYLHALDYARERRQGVLFGGSKREQVPIISHPDVLKDIMYMKAYTEGMRALILYTVYCMDRVSISAGQDEKRHWQDMVEILTPICKAYCSDMGFDVCVRAIQVHGGYGYCREYAVEQFARDCKVTSIYEGTNGIQSIDLLGRKIGMRGGEVFKALVSKITATIEEAKGISDLCDYARVVEVILLSLEEITSRLLNDAASENAYLAYSWASTYLEIMGDIIIGWILLWQAKISYDKLQPVPGVLSSKGWNVKTDSSPRAEFYSRKIATAKFYIASILPLVNGKIASIKNYDRTLLEIKDSFI